jgi:Icc protein
LRGTWLTDIHLNFLKPLALKAFYDRVRQEQPGVLLVTGDIGESDSVVRFVGDLAQIAPIYFVLGNHDYYRSSIAAVRGAVQRLPTEMTWLPGCGPLKITPRATILGVDGWGDARCGDIASKVQLSDWQLIDDFKRGNRLETLQRLGANEARALRSHLAAASETGSEHLLVLTHVPPFPEACVYDDAPSEPGWLPWFTCIATGELLLEHARTHPEQQITVLCGHSHGRGSFAAAPNLTVRTGGWPKGVEGYGNPVVQDTLEL